MSCDLLYRLTHVFVGFPLAGGTKMPHLSLCGLAKGRSGPQCLVHPVRGCLRVIFQTVMEVLLISSSNIVCAGDAGGRWEVGQSRG